MANFLDENGLLYLWQKIKGAFVAKESGKGLSTNDFTTELKNKLDGIEAQAQKNVKPDWSASAGSAAEILNKPTIPSKTSDLTNDAGFITAAQVPEGSVASNVTPKMDGTASVGTDTGFARGDHVHPSDTSKANAADVYKKTKTYSKAEIDQKGFLTEHQDISGKADKSTTLAGYGITDAYTKTETDNKIGELTTGKADKATTLSGYGITDAYTKTEVDGKLSSVYKPGGELYFADLPEPSATNLGFVYSMLDAFTTDDRFIASTPTPYPIGTNVVVVAVDNGESADTYMFDVLAGFVDLSGYWKKVDLVAITNQEIDEIAV